MSTIFSGKRWSIQRFVSGFANNAFLITCVRTGKSVIIDTPAEPVELIAAARATSVQMILITHGHQDHLAGFAAVTAEFSAPVGIGVADQEMLPDQVRKLRELPEFIDVSTGNFIEVGDITLRSLSTPGHTPGSTCYVFRQPPEPEMELAVTSGISEPENTTSHVFTGDTLFPGGPGRSANPEALRQMLESINTHIFSLHESTIVLPGHGEFTSVGSAKAEYAVFASKPLDTNLYGDVTWA